MSDDAARRARRRHQALRRVEFSVCYHRKRERFFDLLDRWAKGIAIIGGSAAFVGLIANGPSSEYLLPGVAALVAISSTLALVFGLADHARRHSELARQFLEIEAEIVGKGEATVEDRDVDAWESRIRAVEIGEPPALNVLVIICQNEVALAAREPIYVLPWWQRALAHWWSFTIDPSKLKRVESAPLTTRMDGAVQNLKATKTRAGLRYGALIAASATVALTTIYLRGDSTGLDVSLARSAGEIVGLALVPMLLLRFVSLRAAVAALAVIAFAYMQSHLQLLG